MTTYPSRRNTRLDGYDYSQAGAYFVTLCVEQRRCLFGAIVAGKFHSSPVGQMIGEVWEELPQHHAGLYLDTFVVMPNHLHGILFLGDTSATGQNKAGTAVPAPTPLYEIIRRFKTFTAYRYRTGFSGSDTLWQRNFHDRIIRNRRELDAIRAYVENNPMQWQLDRENPDR